MFFFLCVQEVKAVARLHICRDYPRPDLGPNNGPFPIQKCAKTSQNGVYHSQFLSSTFW